jgi:hypothetical protein
MKEEKKAWKEGRKKEIREGTETEGGKNSITTTNVDN